MREKWQHKFASKFNTLRARQRKKKNTTGGAHPRRPFVVVVSSAELAREKGAFAFSLRKRL